MDSRKENTNFKGDSVANVADDMAASIKESVACRRLVEEELAHRISFEKVIIDISREFAAILPAKVGEGIQHTLKHVGEFVGVDRCYVFLFSEDKLLMSNISEWCEDGVKPRKSMVQNVKRSDYPWFSLAIEEAESIYIPNVEKLPEEAYVEKKIWQQQGIQSLLAVPLIQQKACIGFIGFDSVKTKKAWKENDIVLLLTVSEFIVEALARKEEDKNQKEYAIKLEEGMVKAIQAIAQTIEQRDPYTAGHQRRVAQLSMAIAQEMNLTESEIRGLQLGALIHDIGKIYVPAEILNRPGALIKTEMDLIRTHPKIGYDIVKEIDFPWPIARMVLSHHERLDGSGYPEGLKGDEIDIFCRILAVSDVVEAMMSHRPYRPALSRKAALDELKINKAVLYDSDVVEVCLKLFEEKDFEFKK